MYCKKCGKKVNDEWKICPYCRTPLNKGTVKRGTYKKRRAKRAQKKIIGVVIVVCLLLLIGTLVKNMASRKNNLTEDQSVAENSSTDRVNTENGYVSLENANVVKDEGNDRKFIDVLVPGVYWKMDYSYQVYGFVDISCVDGNYYLTTMIDDRAVTVGTRWYDKEVLSVNLPINVDNIKSTGEAYCYDDNGNVILVISSFQDGDRIRIDQTEEGAEFIRKSMKTYGDSYKSAFNGDMYRIIADPENHQAPVSMDSDDMWNMLTCCLREGDYKEDTEWTYDEEGNVTRVGDDKITSTCMVYSEDGKMKIDISLEGDCDYDGSSFIEGADLDLSRLYTDGEAVILDPETGEAIAGMITYINAFYLDFYDSEYKGISTEELANKYIVV